MSASMQSSCFRSVGILLLVWAAGLEAWAQQPPSIAYMFPAGGRAGETTEVVLGGYDWTPDMQLFVHDPRITLELLGPPGPVLVPEPPYWFGSKARRPPFPLPRETRARLTIPADVSPGVVRWQAANANGATTAGRFQVFAEPALVREATDHTNPQRLPSLPVTVGGRIEKIEEVDRYRFTADRSGPVTCTVAARAVGSVLNAVIEIRDESGRLIADSVDTAGRDIELTWFAEADHTYEVSLFDLDFRGDRSLVYWLSVIAGPRVVATLPAAGKHGERRAVELIGYGIASGQPKLESVTRQIDFPSDPATTSFAYQLDTPWGLAPPFMLLASERSEVIEGSDGRPDTRQLTVPVALTGVLEERFGEDRYSLAGRKDERWNIGLSGVRTQSPLDVAVAVLDADGNELARADDSADSTDAALEFTVPADGEYQISVTDGGGHGGRRDAVYRLTVVLAEPDFKLGVPEMLNVPIGGKTPLKLTATRAAGFTAEIAISLTGLPSGVAVPEGLAIPAGKTSLDIELTASADAMAVAAIASVSGQAQNGEQMIRGSAGPLLVATTITPPFAIDAEGKDDVTKWPRGTTFPAPVLIEREAGFEQEIVLEMSSRQGRHRQGIRGPEVKVSPGVERVYYPVFLPEWLETTRTSRMVVNGVARVSDPQGNLRYSTTRQKTRMGFLPTGALLKIAAETTEVHAAAGQPIVISVTISRSPQLTEPVLLELHDNDAAPAAFRAQPQTLTADRDRVELMVTRAADVSTAGDRRVTLRATALQQGTLPVISETTVLVQAPDLR